MGDRFVTGKQSVRAQGPPQTPTGGINDDFRPGGRSAMTNNSAALRGVGARVADPAGAECPGCGCELVLHQPDEELADRLLATCGDCKAWFLTAPGGGPLVRLPDADGR
jgi:hypothetical protein